MLPVTEIYMNCPAYLITLALQYIASCWNQDGDPVELLKIADKVSQFRQCLRENPTFLQEKVKKYFKVGKLAGKYLQY